MNTHQVQNRHPRGTSEGGRFAEGVRGEPPRTIDWDARGLDMDIETYVPPVVHGSAIPVSSTADRERWWSNHFVSAGWNAPQGDYPKLPDDYTPRMTGGQALSGSRRTHRMRYGADGVEVRMPSKTSIRRFAKEGNRTFDIPYSTTGADGVTISGWARVSGPQNGLWDVQVLGSKGTSQADMARAAQAREIIHATLEGRRCAIPVSDVNQILAAHKRRTAARGVPVAPVTSKWIRGMGYNEASGTMVMKTDAGKSYGFKVPRETFARIRSARSPGAEFNYRVKGKSERVKVAQCPSCSYYTSDPAAHRCRIEPGQREQSPSGFALAAQAAARDLLGRRRREREARGR